MRRIVWIAMLLALGVACGLKTDVVPPKPEATSPTPTDPPTQPVPQPPEKTE